MLSAPRLHIGQSFCVPTTGGLENWLIDGLHTDVVVARRAGDGLEKRFLRETVEHWVGDAARSIAAFPPPGPSPDDGARPASEVKAPHPATVREDQA